jgi:hypothetical protein
LWDADNHAGYLVYGPDGHWVSKELGYQDHGTDGSNVTKGLGY